MILIKNGGGNKQNTGIYDCRVFFCPFCFLVFYYCREECIIDYKKQIRQF